METIKSWAISVIAAAVITAVISIAAPTGNMNKSVKIITALFMLLCFASPLVNGDFETDFNGFDYEISEWLSDSELEAEIRNQITDKLENEIKSEVGAYLKNMEVNEFEIDVRIKADENNSIEIKKIEIVLPTHEKLSQISDYVYENFGIIPDVTVKR